MNEHATKALRKKLIIAFQLAFKALEIIEIDVFSSSGNTGAMLVGSIFPLVH